MSMLPIYIFGALSNALVSSINSRKQQALNKEIADDNRAAQRETLLTQLEQQCLLHREGYKQQIANQLRAYELTHTWPLDTTPAQIAQMIEDDGNVPMYLVIAPAVQSGIQKELSSVWTEISNFVLTIFRASSDTPVIHGGYRQGYSVSPTQDYMKIFAGISSVPTLYIAPFSGCRDNVLGITMAFWGMNSSGQRPIAQNFEIDIRKLYVDEIRKETLEYESKCVEKGLPLETNPDLQKNIEIFKQEKDYIAKDLSYEYLDQVLNHYKGLRPVKETYLNISKKIIPMIQMLSVAVADLYFVLEYGTMPKLPGMLGNEKFRNNIPELIMRGVLDPTDNFTTISGEDFAKNLLSSYSTMIAKNAPAETAAHSIQLFQSINHALPNAFEAEFCNRYFPDCNELNTLDDKQQKILQILNRQSIRLQSPNHQGIQRRIDGYLAPSYDEAVKLLKNEEYSKVIPILKQLASTNPEAMYNLGICYLNGLGCAKNEDMAIWCFEVSGKSNVIAALKILAKLYDRRQRSEQDVIRVLERAIELGDKESIFNLGVFYLKKDKLELAKKCFLVSYKNGNKDAKTILDTIQTEGENNVDKNDSLFRRAVNATVRFLDWVAPGSKEYKPGQMEKTTYKDLYDFALKTKNLYPETVLSRVVCDFDHTRKQYKITQLSLNAREKAISDGDNYVGRSFYTSEIDEQIIQLMQNKELNSFDIPVHDTKGAGK